MPSGEQVFKFDSFDKDRLLPIHHAAAISKASSRHSLQEDGHHVHHMYAHGHHAARSAESAEPAGPGPGPGLAAAAATALEERREAFSPASGRSPHSSLSSPQVSVDSPRICFSPLRIKDSIEEEDSGETGAEYSET